jgi:hypothetical protein
MNETKTIAYQLRLLASTIEELEITDIICAEVNQSGEMLVHLWKLDLDPPDCTWIKWTERHCSSYNWEKSFTYNNVKFFSLCTQEAFQKEIIS